LKIIGMFIVLLSGYWLSQGFDFGLFMWFIFGIFITLLEEILSHFVVIIRKSADGKRK
jgi:hypothetical protein